MFPFLVKKVVPLFFAWSCTRQPPTSPGPTPLATLTCQRYCQQLRRQRKSKKQPHSHMKSNNIRYQSSAIWFQGSSNIIDPWEKSHPLETKTTNLPYTWSCYPPEWEVACMCKFLIRCAGCVKLLPYPPHHQIQYCTPDWMQIKNLISDFDAERTENMQDLPE